MFNSTCFLLIVTIIVYYIYIYIYIYTTFLKLYYLSRDFNYSIKLNEIKTISEMEMIHRLARLMAYRGYT